MDMASQVRRWTRAEVLALPDDGMRYELIDGELLVTPSPAGPHQRAVMALYDRVSAYVRAHRLGYTCVAPADLDLRGEQVAQPDLFVVPLVEDREPVEWPEFGIPMLIAEVLSPSTARYDRITKRRRYQRSGVGLYWIVDLDARLVECWRPDDERPQIAAEQLSWQPRREVAELTVDLPRLFREIRAEAG
ncbi:MAG: Uma2 family endonuclease [Gemmatimonadales bacterium]